jgi:hypothetical protein
MKMILAREAENENGDPQSESPSEVLEGGSCTAMA